MHHCHCTMYTHTRTPSFCFLELHPIMLLRGRLVSRSKILRIVAELLHASCSSYCPINSIKALKDDSVPDWVQHTVMVSQEHCFVIAWCTQSKIFFRCVWSFVVFGQLVVYCLTKIGNSSLNLKMKW